MPTKTDEKELSRMLDKWQTEKVDIIGMASRLVRSDEEGPQKATPSTKDVAAPISSPTPSAIQTPSLPRKSPTVFISYSHDSPSHKQWVLQLATLLRNNGVDAILDVWDLGAGEPAGKFMELGVANARRVLMICTEKYVEKANSPCGGGVG